MKHSIEDIVTPAAPTPAGHYVQAAAWGSLIFVSGQLPIRADGTPGANDPFEDQVRLTLANVMAILEAAGSGPEGVLKVTAYIVGVAHWPAFNSIYAEVFGSARPARAVVPVPALHHGCLIEIEATAVRRDALA